MKPTISQNDQRCTVLPLDPTQRLAASGSISQPHSSGEIADVHVERLQNISEEQALAEGIAKHPGGGHHVEDGKYYWVSPNDSFAGLWASVGGNGDTNPWVWVVEFKRVTP